MAAAERRRRRGGVVADRPAERCCVCDEPMGKAGEGEDSLYCCGMGPFCEACFDDHQRKYGVHAEVSALLCERDAAYKKGLIDGLTRFAWWKDGVQYVGTSGTTLKQAIKDAEA